MFNKLLMLFAFLFIFGLNAQNNAIIIDHSCIDLTKIPETYINKAKQTIVMCYGHTSYGSQIVTGMKLLNDRTASIYKYNSGAGSLTLKDNSPAGDLGDRYLWPELTREYLANNPAINTVMWSWEKQLSAAPFEYVDIYLSSMDALEKEYPKVKFIYMTGATDGTGIGGTLNICNEQIRQYCRNNNKILYPKIMLVLTPHTVIVQINHLNFH